MNVLAEHHAGALRMQVLECDCKPECETVIIIGQLGSKPYWLTLGIVPLEHVGANVAAFGQQPEIYADILRGIALFGVKYDRLVSDRGECFRQLEAWMSAPDWLDNLDLELIWRTRRVVFGDDFSRVVRALEAVDRAVPEIAEGPVPAPGFLALVERQMRVQYAPRSMS